jgi:hypothetical protein
MPQPLAILLFVLCLTPAFALACSCEESSESELQRLDRAFQTAATVAVMKVVGFKSDDAHQVVTDLQFQYVFKETAASSPPYRGRGAFSGSSESPQMITSCDIQLDEGQLVLAFADTHGEVHFGGCYPVSGPIDFNLLPRLYELKANAALIPGDGT